MEKKHAHFFHHSYQASPYFLIDHPRKVNIIKAGIVGKGLAIDEYSIPRYQGKKKRFYLQYFYNILLRKSVHVDFPVTVIHNPWCPGYFHWVTEALIRLLLFDAHSNSTGKIVLPESYRKLPYVEGSIGLLSTREIFYLPEGSCLKTNCLSYVSNNYYTGTYPPSLILLLKKKLIQHVDFDNKVSGKRIYVSRSKAATRTLANEGEVITILSEYNFLTVFFEDLTFAEQISLMAETECMVSVHGAGLTNLMFMPPGSSVMELQKVPNKGERPSGLYHQLAEVCGIKYFYQFGRAVDKADNIYTSDIYIDKEQFRKNLELMLGGTQI